MLTAAETRAVWAAIVLSRRIETCDSILRGLPVRVGNLDRFVLRRALRGGRLPHPESYITIGAEELAAVCEAGPLPERTDRRQR